MKIDITNDPELRQQFRHVIGIHPELGSILHAHAMRQPTIDHWYPLHEFSRKPATTNQPVVVPKPAITPETRAAREQLDRIEHAGIMYITVNEARKIAIGTPLESIAPFQSGNVYSHTSHRLQRIRRLELGPDDILPTVLYAEDDCHALLRARLAGKRADTLPSHDPCVVRIADLTHRGERWIKFSEALAMIHDIPVKVVSRLWTTRLGQTQLDMPLLTGFSNQVQNRIIPSIVLGYNKSTYVRHADAMAYTNANRHRPRKRVKA